MTASISIDADRWSPDGTALTLPELPDSFYEPAPESFAAHKLIISYSFHDFTPGSTVSGVSTGGAEVVYRPRTSLGRRLLALRNAYIARGGELMSAEQLAAELRERRGGVG